VPRTGGGHGLAPRRESPGGDGDVLDGKLRNAKALAGGTRFRKTPHGPALGGVAGVVGGTRASYLPGRKEEAATVCDHSGNGWHMRGASRRVQTDDEKDVTAPTRHARDAADALRAPVTDREPGRRAACYVGDSST